VLVEPGTPQGSNIISQMRSHILWMEKRRSRKLQNAANKASKDLMTLKTGAFIVAPCPHDGPCPLQNTDKYCHFVQRLERTSSQRFYKETIERHLIWGISWGKIVLAKSIPESSWKNSTDQSIVATTTTTIMNTFIYLPPYTVVALPRTVCSYILKLALL
ncbi:UNVERIFIED_CONTAM: hypothetical protein Sradi_1857200, partial [Sesamum radiatum]